MTQEFDLHAAIRKLAEAVLPDGSVPFAALRVPCQQQNHHSYLDTSSGCPSCYNRAWVPETDVEKACWRIFENHPAILRCMIEQGKDGPYVELEVKEALIRAALAWLEEQDA